MADKQCSLSECDRVEQLRRGLCKYHYRRLIQFGDPRKSRTAPRHLSLWQRLEFHGWIEVVGTLDTPCWEFRVGTTSRNGYGSVRAQGKTHMAHRVSYEHTYGPIPEGLIVLHACDNPPCMNPGHLRAGSVRENTQDMLDRGRHIPPVGERNGMSRITDDVAWSILDTRAESGRSYVDIAKQFGVSMSLVALIVKGRRWRHTYEAWRLENPLADLRVLASHG